jgi:hypothetical protein
MRGGKSLEKDGSRVPPRGSVANGPFSPINSVACKPPSNPDLGSFVRAQIVAHQDDPNSITFALADGSTGRAWLASDNHGSNLIGDDRLWRNNIEELVRQKERRPKAVSWLPAAQTLRRPIIVVGRNDPVQDVDDGSLVAMTQFKTLTMRLGW